MLAVDQQATLNFELKPVSVNTTVEVTEAPPLLDTDNAAIGTDVTNQYVRDIPLYNRSLFGLVFLAGGVTETSGSGINDNYPSGTNFVSNGQRNATAQISLDGSPLSAPEQGEGGNSNVYYQPSVEIVQEFKVQNNSFSGGVRQQRRHRREHRAEAGHEPVPRQRMVVRAAVELRCPRFLQYRRKARSRARSVWFRRRRADHEEQDVLLLWISKRLAAAGSRATSKGSCPRIWSGRAISRRARQHCQVGIFDPHERWDLRPLCRTNRVRATIFAMRHSQQNSRGPDRSDRTSILNFIRTPMCLDAVLSGPQLPQGDHGQYRPRLAVRRQVDHQIHHQPQDRRTLQPAPRESTDPTVVGNGDSGDGSIYTDERSER